MNNWCKDTLFIHIHKKKREKTAKAIKIGDITSIRVMPPKQYLYSLIS